MRLLVFFATFLILANNAPAFIIQTSPPPVVGSFACDCSQVVSCLCKLGDVTATVLLNTKDWQKHADKSLLGSRICSSKCIAAIGQVVRVSAPFLSIQTLERAEKSATATKRKTIGRTEKGSATISPGAPGVGAGYITEESRGVTKEKSLSVLKAKAKTQGIDLTTFFILELTRQLKGEVNVYNVFEVLEELVLANAQGKLEDYLSQFFK